jgi:hypothetical protein
MQQTLRKVIFAAVFDQVHFDGTWMEKSGSGYGSLEKSRVKRVSVWQNRLFRYSLAMRNRGLLEYETEEKKHFNPVLIFNR